MLATGDHVGKEKLQSLCCLSVGQAILFHFQSRYARGFVPTAYARGFVPTAGRHRLCVSRVVPTAKYAPGSVPTAATSRLPDSRSNQVSCINVINIYIYMYVLPAAISVSMFNRVEASPGTVKFPSLMAPCDRLTDKVKFCSSLS